MLNSNFMTFLLTRVPKDQDLFLPDVMTGLTPVNIDAVDVPLCVCKEHGGSDVLCGDVVEQDRGIPNWFLSTKGNVRIPVTRK